MSLEGGVQSMWSQPQEGRSPWASLLLPRDLPGAAALPSLGQKRGGQEGGTGQSDKLLFPLCNKFPERKI